MARARGTSVVVARASAHIATQSELLVEEFGRFGFRAESVSPAMIEREEMEYEGSDRIQVFSSFAERSFLDRGIPRERLLRMPMGIDVREVSADARPAPMPGAPLRVLFLGIVGLRKGVPYLLEAVRRLGPHAVELSLYGGLAPEGRELLQRCGGTAAWRGKVGRHELAKVLAAHDVLVLPSVEDGFGMVITEAMAAGLPVIASTHTGGPDVIREGETGFIVPPRAVDLLAERLEYLVSHREQCHAMGMDAAASMRVDRSWDRAVDVMLEQYRAEFGPRVGVGRA